MAPPRETLARIPLFRSLGAEAIRDLDGRCTWRHAEAKEWIINYRDPGNDVFFVASGAVRVMIQSTSGRDVLLRDIGEGEFFGELAAIDGQPRSAGIVAVTNATVARMAASVFRAAVHGHEDVGDQLLALLARQIRTLSQRVNEFSTLNDRSRIYAELLRLSRPAAEPGGGAVVSPPPMHAEIAARVSTRREAVARELKALERDGLLLRRRGALVLTDPDRLEQLIERAEEAD